MRDRLAALLGRSAMRADLVPQARLSGPMPWVVAIMVALTVIAASGALALRNAAQAARAELSGGVTVQIVEADPVQRARQSAAALARLREMPDVESLREVPPAEVDALLEPWLGAAATAGGADALPVPALIDVRVRGGAEAARLAALRGALRPVAPSAQVDAQAAWLRPVFSAIQSLQWLALALIALLAAAMAASVLLAARTALGAHRGTIEIVHLLGATDAQVARLFQRSIGIDALLGGLAGLAAAAGAVVLLARQFAGLAAGLVGSGALGAGDWAILCLIPLAGAGLAMITARISILRALRNMV